MGESERERGKRVRGRGGEWEGVRGGGGERGEGNCQYCVHKLSL